MSSVPSSLHHQTCTPPPSHRDQVDGYVLYLISSRSSSADVAQTNETDLGFGSDRHLSRPDRRRGFDLARRAAASPVRST